MWTYALLYSFHTPNRVGSSSFTWWLNISTWGKWDQGERSVWEVESATTDAAVVKLKFWVEGLVAPAAQKHRPQTSHHYLQRLFQYPHTLSHLYWDGNKATPGGNGDRPQTVSRCQSAGSPTCQCQTKIRQGVHWRIKILILSPGWRAELSWRWVLLKHLIQLGCCDRIVPTFRLVFMMFNFITMDSNHDLC